MIVLFIIALIFLCISLILGYLCWVNVKKTKTALKYAEWYGAFIFILLKKVKEVKIEMDQIDSRGSFKSDDEVGFTFEALNSCIQELDDFIEANLKVVDDDKS